MTRAPLFFGQILFRTKAVLVAFDHLLDHLSADGTCLTGGDVAVVTLVEVYADFAGGLHLELLHGVLRAGNRYLITLSHLFILSAAVRQRKEAPSRPVAAKF